VDRFVTVFPESADEKKDEQNEPNPQGDLDAEVVVVRCV
jgi:hypothetical protein